MDNDELYQKALEAITALFSDNSVSQEKCRENLQSLKGEIDQLIDTLD
ncbi:MAG: hypothetical protein WC341_00615 [Bacteroidales bacterium]